MASCKDCVYSFPEADLLGIKAPQAEPSYYCGNLNMRNVDVTRANVCTFFKPKSSQKSWSKRDLLEFKRSFLLTMPEREIAMKYNISMGYVGMLRSALKRERFDTLVCDTITSAEISEKLGISKNSIRAYLTALQKVGFIVKRPR